MPATVRITINEDDTADISYDCDDSEVEILAALLMEVAGELIGLDEFESMTVH